MFTMSVKPKTSVLASASNHTNKKQFSLPLHRDSKINMEKITAFWLFIAFAQNFLICTTNTINASSAGADQKEMGSLGGVELQKRVQFSEDSKTDQNENDLSRLCVTRLQSCSRRKKCCQPLECTRVGGGGPKNEISVCLEKSNDNNGTNSPGGNCPYQATIEQILEPLRDGDEFERTVGYLEKRKSQFITASAYRGDSTRNYHLAIRNIHLAMRESYRDMIREIGNNIYPLIIASDNEPGSVSGVGGFFTLYLEDGSKKRISPTSPEFEMLKNLAHIPLGLFTIVSPYFLVPKATGWRLPLQNFYNKIVEAAEAANLGELAIANSLRLQGIAMLSISKVHIQRWLDKGFVTVSDFEVYSSEMYPYIERNIKRAAALQVQALLPQMQKWKDELGERWKDVYALIPTIWPVSAINPRMQILAQLMSPEQIKTQVFLLENGGTVLDQRASLGRIVGDRAAALLILNTKNEEQKRLTFALSTKQDLLANSCADAISDYFRMTPKIIK